MTFSKKRILGVSFTAIAAFLVVASAAFACTSFKGWLKVCNSASACATSNGAGSNMSQSFNTGTGPSIARGASFTVEAGALTGNQLPDGAYRITYWKGSSGYAYDRPIANYATVAQHWKNDCMSSSLDELLGNVVFLRNATVTSGATGVLSTTLPSTAPVSAAGKQSAVCISNSGAAYGNQVPIVIT